MPTRDTSGLVWPSHCFGRESINMHLNLWNILKRFFLSAALLLLFKSSSSPPLRRGIRCQDVASRDIVIPTYLAGARSRIRFSTWAATRKERRASSTPIRCTTFSSSKVDKTYKIVYLENEYIGSDSAEIGGRLFEGVDKTNGYNFIYRQHVIKPALIGLIGAWISGGIEWNIPHHHRASTFLPVQYSLEENADGSKTVWVGELEVRQRMRWAVGYTLPPGKSYLEARVRILNRTPVSNSMLCFANVAVHVNEITRLSSRPARNTAPFTASASSFSGPRRPPSTPARISPRAST